MESIFPAHVHWKKGGIFASDNPKSKIDEIRNTISVIVSTTVMTSEILLNTLSQHAKCSASSCANTN